MSTGMPPGPGLALLQSIRHAWQPNEFYQRWRDDFGDPFTLPHLLGPLVVTGHPSAIQRILSGTDEFEVYAPHAVTPLVGTTSVSVIDDEPHVARRRQLSPAFHGEQMRAFGRTLIDIARRESAKWKPGEPFALHPSMINISLEAMVRVVVGLTDADDVEVCRDVVERYVQAYTPAITIIKSLRRDFFGVGPWANFMKLKAELHATLDRFIHAARKDGGSGILGMLVATRYDDGTSLTDEVIRDQLVTLMFAGHETTGAALAWAFSWILANPEILAKLRAEIGTLGGDPSPDQIADLKYLAATCNEALRLKPIVPEIFRQLRKPMTLRGYDLPSGIGVCGSVILLHLDPNIYPEPTVFRPERFLERQFAPYEFLPFGGGIRRCIGAAFAVYEMKLVLATLLRDQELHLISKGDESASARHGLVMVPHDGVRVTYTGARTSLS